MELTPKLRSKHYEPMGSIVVDEILKMIGLVRTILQRPVERSKTQAREVQRAPRAQARAAVRIAGLLAAAVPSGSGIGTIPF